MNSLDLIVIGVVVLSGLFAFLRGFVREALSILAWLGAAAVAYYLFSGFAPLVEKLISNVLVAQVVTAGLLFVVSLLVFSFFVGVISSQVRASGMGSVDRSLGLLFGLVRGAIVLCLAYLVTVHLFEPGVWPPKPDGLPPWIAEAKLRPYLEDGADPLYRMIPQQLLDKSTNAAASAAQTIENGGDAKDVLDSLRQEQQDKPKPAPPPDGYDSGQRQDMNRAIQQSTDQ